MQIIHASDNLSDSYDDSGWSHCRSEALKTNVHACLDYVYVKWSQISVSQTVRQNVDGIPTCSSSASWLLENAWLVASKCDSVCKADAQTRIYASSHSWIKKRVNESIVILSDDLQHNKVSMLPGVIFSVSLQKKYDFCKFTINVANNFMPSDLNPFYTGSQKWHGNL